METGEKAHVTASVLPGEIRDLLESRIENSSFDLPLLPDVAMRVMTLCSFEDSDAAQLSEVLHQDQAFAGHVLRIANSPVMMPKVPIVSLQQAVSRLGMTAVAEIALAISVQSKTFNVAGHMELVRKLWRHSLGAGSFAKEIARVRRRNVEGAFLCGLLHDVGKPIVLDSITELEKERGKDYSLDVLTAAMDLYHDQVGALLAKEWGLPQQVAEAIRYHHDYKNAPSFTEAAMMVNLADHLTHLALPTTRELVEQEVRGLAVVQELNLYSDDFDELLDHAQKIILLVEAMA